MIKMTITMKARPEKREELLQVVHSVLEGEERHLVGYQEAEDTTVFRLTYEWNSREELERFAGTEKFRILLEAIKVLCENSEMSFWPYRSLAGHRTSHCRP